MLAAPNFHHFGGQVTESAVLKNLLAYLGVKSAIDNKPFSEALCFGLAGGIGAGYSNCPSVLRYGGGSGISIPGRYKVYATDATWYQGFCDRLGIRTHITETSAEKKALHNLAHELEAGRPTVVWCSRMGLTFLQNPSDSCNGFMHTCLVYGLDPDNDLAYGSDRAATAVTLSLADLAKARKGVCSHKNRTLTMDAPAQVSGPVLQQAIGQAIAATTAELIRGQMKTYSLPGLEIWAKAIANDKAKEGWLKCFTGGILYQALRDVFESIEAMGAGGGLMRGLYADFLDEVGRLTKNKGLAASAKDYRKLALAWTELAEACLPSSIKPFQKTKKLIRKRCRLFVEQGEAAFKTIADANLQLRALQGETRAFPLDPTATRQLMEQLADRILTLHAAEETAARQLQRAA